VASIPSQNRKPWPDHYSLRVPFIKEVLTKLPQFHNLKTQPNFECFCLQTRSLPMPLLLFPSSVAPETVTQLTQLAP
jgi:hypothetical protein